MISSHGSSLIPGRWVERPQSLIISRPGMREHHELLPFQIPSIRPLEGSPLTETGPTEWTMRPLQPHGIQQRCPPRRVSEDLRCSHGGPACSLPGMPRCSPRFHVRTSRGKAPSWKQAMVCGSTRPLANLHCLEDQTTMPGGEAWCGASVFHEGAPVAFGTQFHHRVVGDASIQADIHPDVPQGPFPSIGCAGSLGLFLETETAHIGAVRRALNTADAKDLSASGLRLPGLGLAVRSAASEAWGTCPERKNAGLNTSTTFPSMISRDPTVRLGGVQQSQCMAPGLPGSGLITRAKSNVTAALMWPIPTCRCRPRSTRQAHPPRSTSPQDPQRPWVVDASTHRPN